VDHLIERSWHHPWAPGRWHVTLDGRPNCRTVRGCIPDFLAPLLLEDARVAYSATR
jgi:hypothetical protein